MMSAKTVMTETPVCSAPVSTTNAGAATAPGAKERRNTARMRV